MGGWRWASVSPSPSDGSSPRAAAAVEKGRTLLEQLHAYVAEIAPLRHDISDRAWLHGLDDRLECPAGLPDILKRCIGADELEDLHAAMVGVVEEVTDGSPSNDCYRAAIQRFGLSPIRTEDGSGRAGTLTTEQRWAATSAD